MLAASGLRGPPPTEFAVQLGGPEAG
jgi:hypothetical protein